MKKRFSDDQIISIPREAEDGISARELCSKHAFSEATFAPDVRSLKAWVYPEVKRLKPPEEENARLKTLLAETRPDKEALQVTQG